MPGKNKATLACMFLIYFKSNVYFFMIIFKLFFGILFYISLQYIYIYMFIAVKSTIPVLIYKVIFGCVAFAEEQ